MLTLHIILFLRHFTLCIYKTSLYIVLVICELIKDGWGASETYYIGDNRL